MKILYITNGINGSGGLERVLSIKASYLVEHFKHEVHIAGLNDSTNNLFYKFNDEIKMHNVDVKGNPFNYISNYILGLKKLCKQIQPDIICVCDDGLKAFFLPIILGKNCPVIYERHVSKNIEVKNNASFLSKIITNVKLFLMDILSKKFDKFVVLTNQNKKEWIGNNIEVIANPLSFYPQESSNLSHKKVIVVGKHCYQKGYDRLLIAWHKVVQEHPEWQLEIYGKLDAAQPLQKQALDLKIVNSVSFFSPEKNIMQKYLSSSIYVMSSRFEGFGMVLIEAMACGLPCVSFDCPYGPSDIIQDNQDGFIVENGNIDALAQKINILIENEALRQKMGNAAKQNVKRFLPEIIMQKWDNLFKTLRN